MLTIKTLLENHYNSVIHSFLDYNTVLHSAYSLYIDQKSCLPYANLDTYKMHYTRKMHGKNNIATDRHTFEIIAR